MLSWGEFASAQREMAEVGEKSAKLGVMYLATIRRDGYPRVHPFTPFIGSGRLFAFMEPTSPKAKDLQRNGRYSMHSLVADMHGTNGEFQISGDALQVRDPSGREAAIAACPYRDAETPFDKYLLFEFRIDRCLAKSYGAGGAFEVKHWKE